MNNIGGLVHRSDAVVRGPGKCYLPWLLGWLLVSHLLQPRGRKCVLAKCKGHGSVIKSVVWYPSNSP